MNLPPPLRPLVPYASLLLGLLGDISPLPDFMEPGRPLWLALALAFWTLYLPSRAGFACAFVFGLMQDVLLGTLFGQQALVLLWVVFCIRLLERRLLRASLWWQSQWLLLVFASSQLLSLWLGVLQGARPELLPFLLPAFVSAVLWPWVSFLLRSVQRWFNLSEAVD